MPSIEMSWIWKINILILEQQRSMFQILEATGCPFDKEKLLKETVHYDIRDFGAA